jgi:hypothetical protein
VTIAVSAVMLLCIYTLFMKAHEIDNWGGFWFSAAHVVIVGCGAWFSLRKVS